MKAKGVRRLHGYDLGTLNSNGSLATGVVFDCWRTRGPVVAIQRAKIELE